jgi:creatinine amidohydrolase
MNLARVAWVDVEERLRISRLALVPVGAVEVYGPHLPQGTDGIVAEALCERIAELTNCIVTPLVPVGWSESLRGFPGTLSVRPEVLKSYCEDMLRSLLRWGVRTVVFINGHLGNVAVLQDLCLEYNRPGEGCRVLQIDLWRFMQPMAENLLRGREWKFGHAGECMTAVMMHLRREWVRPDRFQRFFPEDPTVATGLFVPRSYREYAPLGFVGDPTLATSEIGEGIFRQCVDRIIEILSRLQGSEKIT